MATNEIIAEITPSPARRLVSVTIVMTLGAMVIWLAISTASVQLIGRLVLVAVGVAAIIFGDRLRRATSLTVMMTTEALIDSSGREICRLDDIVGIDRGAFAFKPANGFLLKLKQKSSRVWAPGLWWRFGRRVGVGGTTPSGQGKFMAEAIAMRIGQ